MRTFWTIVALVLVVGLGIWLYNRQENNLATEGGNATTTENGIGGPEDGFDPLNGIDDSGTSTDDSSNSGSDNYDINGKG